MSDVVEKTFIVRHVRTSIFEGRNFDGDFARLELTCVNGWEVGTELRLVVRRQRTPRELMVEAVFDILKDTDCSVLTERIVDAVEAVKR